MRDPLAKPAESRRGGGEVVQPPSFFHSSYRIGEGEVWMELERRSVQYMYLSLLPPFLISEPLGRQEIDIMC